MKKLISIMLSVLMICSALSGISVFASENIDDAADSKAVICKGLLETESLKFDKNYFFLAELEEKTDIENETGNFIWKIYNDTGVELEAAIVKYYEGEASFITGYDLNNENSEIGKTIKFSDNESAALIYAGPSYKTFTPCHVGFFIQNSDLVTEETTITVELFTAKIDTNSYTIIPDALIDTVTHTFDAPVSIEGFSKFSSVLTDIKFGNTIDASDVVNALNESATKDDKRGLNAVLDDSNMAVLKKALTNEYTSISVDAVDGIEIPYAALAAVPGETSTVYTPVLEEKGSTNGEANTKTYKYDIKLNASVDGAESTALTSLAVKQKVVLSLPADLDLSKTITVKHGDVTLASTVADGNVSFFTDSFSEFSITGTVVDDTADTNKAENVKYQITQDSENPNKFSISIVPVGKDAQIIRFANAPMRFEFMNGGYSIGEGEGMKSFSYTITEAQGIDIVNRTDLEKGSTANMIGGFTFVAKAEDDESLYTAGVNQPIKIADIEIKGNGKFWVFCDAIETTERYIYTETIEDNQVELAKVQNVDSEVFDIPEKKLALTFKVDFGKNVIVSEDADYIGMTIAIKGINSDKEYTAKVGKISDEDAAAGVVGLTLTSADTATALGSIELPANDRYEFEVSGVGYRTFRGNVLLDTPKTVNLWTYAETDYNADGEEVPFDKAVIEGEDTIMKDVTFLVGDIYMDNIVDIYDISAVLSYYGKTGIQTGEKYVAHDLNRDGKINSADLAYVQVSYGN